MSEIKHLTLPLTRADIEGLKNLDVVRLSGTIYTARDAAHARLVKQLNDPPIKLAGACIYYCGPCPAAPGEVIGPCGPTTSARMDRYTPALIDAGVTAFIGKGPRNAEVMNALDGRAVYFAATGGAGILLARCVKSARVVAYDDLGTEAIRELVVENMPLIVIRK